MMTSWNYDPFRELNKIQRQMDRVFNDISLAPTLLTPGTSTGDQQLATTNTDQLGTFLRPVIDVRETDKNLLVHAELPGLDKNSVNVDVDGNILTISGEKKYEKKDENERELRLERSYGKFQRSMMIPEGVDASKINAKFDNGVLELCIPKPQQKTSTKKINIR